MYKILFPHEPFDKRNVDSAYLEEYNTCKLIGIDTYFFDFDKFVEESKLSSNINMDDKCTLIYRGWMMKPEQYSDFYVTISRQSNSRIKLKNNPLKYKNCHCFPNVYETIKDLTPRMVSLDDYTILPSYKSVLKNIDFDFFIKDHVKSIKTDQGVERISKDINCIDLFNKVNDFVKERGNLFTNGIVLKEFVNLKKVDGKTNEWRVFLMDGKFLCMMQNSNLPNSVAPPFTMILVVRELLESKSNLFTVDFAQLENGDWTIIETGDGQVSGFPDSFNPIGFYNKLIQS